MECNWTGWSGSIDLLPISFSKEEYAWRENWDSFFLFTVMKNENYNGDNNKNSSMSGQAEAVHYSQLLWAVW